MISTRFLQHNLPNLQRYLYITSNSVPQVLLQLYVCVCTYCLRLYRISIHISESGNFTVTFFSSSVLCFSVDGKQFMQIHSIDQKTMLRMTITFFQLTRGCGHRLSRNWYFNFVFFFFNWLIGTTKFIVSTFADTCVYLYMDNFPSDRLSSWPTSLQTL